LAIKSEVEGEGNWVLIVQLDKLTDPNERNRSLRGRDGTVEAG